MKHPHPKQARYRHQQTRTAGAKGPKMIGDKRKSIAVEFNLNDPEHRALYRMVQSAGDVNAFLLRMLKQLHKRLHRSRSRDKTPWTDKVLDQIKREVELEEEKDAMKPVFFQVRKGR